MLERFRKAKGSEIEALRSLENQGLIPEPLELDRPSFSKGLLAGGPGAIIAEYKRASPSQGEINLDLSPQEVAGMYARAGAAAISVLTEKKHFQGSLEYVGIMAEAGLPILRKDFLFHRLQVRATAATRASALLLIARMFTRPEELEVLLDLCRDLGLEAVTEIFDARDLTLARSAGAKIIQVNNRDLETLSTDLDNSRRLVGAKHPGELWISASGISRPEEVSEMASLGFDAVLIGTSLMESDNPEKRLKELVEAMS